MIQLPPSLEFDHVRARKFLSLLRGRFSGDVAWEPRHASWFEDQSNNLLEEFHIARVAADPACVPTATRPGGLASLAYFRLHGSPRRYFSAYSSDSLNMLVAQLVSLDATSNGSISEYKIGSTGALAKIAGSPITGLTNPVALIAMSYYNWLYVMDPSPNVVDVYKIDPSTGKLTLSSSEATGGNSPQAIAVDPFGQFTLIVNTASNDVAIGMPNVGVVGTVATGLSPVAITIDPTSQFVYVANSGDNTVSAYSLSLASPYMTQIGSAIAAGTTPSAVVAEPYGKYLYVANSGSNTISAYSINALTGAPTPITGTFSTLSGPSALSISNDGRYLYVTDKVAGQLEQFTINTDGTLTYAGGAGLGTAPTSITTIGTYR